MIVVTTTRRIRPLFPPSHTFLSRIGREKCIVPNIDSFADFVDYYSRLQEPLPNFHSVSITQPPPPPPHGPLWVFLFSRFLEHHRHSRVTLAFAFSKTHCIRISFPLTHSLTHSFIHLSVHQPVHPLSGTEDSDPPLPEFQVNPIMFLGFLDLPWKHRLSSVLDWI